MGEKEGGEGKTWGKNPKNCIFWGIYLKSQHIQFLVHGQSSSSTFGCTPSEESKGFRNCIPHKYNHGKCDREKKVVLHGTTS